MSAFVSSSLRYVTNPDFDPNNIRSVSSACEGLCRWVRAMEVYERVAKVGSLKPSKSVLWLVRFFTRDYKITQCHTGSVKTEVFFESSQKLKTSKLYSVH